MADSVSYRVDGTILIDEDKLLASQVVKAQLQVAERISSRLGLSMITPPTKYDARVDYSDS